MVAPFGLSQNRAVSHVLAFWFAGETGLAASSGEPSVCATRVLPSFPRSSVGMPVPALQRHIADRRSGQEGVPTLERGNQKNDGILAKPQTMAFWPGGGRGWVSPSVCTTRFFWAFVVARCVAVCPSPPKPQAGVVQAVFWFRHGFMRVRSVQVFWLGRRRSVVPAPAQPGAQGVAGLYFGLFSPSSARPRPLARALGF